MMKIMNYIIKTDNLTKHFGTVHAVENISLKVRKGEIYGFLGLNGAGKTTTIRMLLGMIRPTAGSAFLLEEQVDAGSCELWKKVGYLVETPYSYPKLATRIGIIHEGRLIREVNTDQLNIFSTSGLLLMPAIKRQ
jgi:ABC-2 type transport system ATP-binding protein